MPRRRKRIGIGVVRIANAGSITESASSVKVSASPAFVGRGTGSFSIRMPELIAVRGCAGCAGCAQARPVARQRRIAVSAFTPVMLGVLDHLPHGVSHGPDRFL